MKTTAAQGDRLSHGRVLKIALPIMISNATIPILGAVDTGVVGQLGQAAPIGAVGIGAIILTSVYCRPKSSLSAAEANSVLDRAYANETFVRVLPVGETPNLAAVRGTNFCDVAAFVDEPNETLILLSALDNLVKGASGQAIQCANLMQGHSESQGLLGTALLP